MKKVIIKREKRAFDVRMEYSRKVFGQKFIDYLDPKHYNLMPVNIKRDIYSIHIQDLYRKESYNYRDEKNSIPLILTPTAAV